MCICCWKATESIFKATFDTSREKRRRKKNEEMTCVSVCVLCVLVTRVAQLTV